MSQMAHQDKQVFLCRVTDLCLLTEFDCNGNERKRVTYDFSLIDRFLSLPEMVRFIDLQCTTNMELFRITGQEAGPGRFSFVFISSSSDGY